MIDTVSAHINKPLLFFHVNYNVKKIKKIMHFFTHKLAQYNILFFS